jgi:hypothetical protein
VRERLLGILDAIAWCWAKGGRWQAHIRPDDTVKAV